MLLADEMHQEIILDHNQNPRNKYPIENPTLANHGHNPLCGDEIDVYLDLDASSIQKITFGGKSCSICQASASMMTEALEGKSLQQVEHYIDGFKKMMLENGESLADQGYEFEDLEALEGVKKYPVRIKCALLAWNTLQEALKPVMQK